MTAAEVSRVWQASAMTVNAAARSGDAEATSITACSSVSLGGLFIQRTRYAKHDVGGQHTGNPSDVRPVAPPRRGWAPRCSASGSADSLVSAAGQ